MPLHIQQYRKQRRITQDELAKVLDLDQSAISRIESGDRKLTIDELAKLARFFGVGVLDLWQPDPDEVPA